MSEVFSVRVNWSKIKNPIDLSAPGFIKKKLTQLAKEGNEFAQQHLDGAECVYVYGPCGSCGEEQYRVDAYCDGEGTGQPDFTWCEPC